MTGWQHAARWGSLLAATFVLGCSDSENVGEEEIPSTSSTTNATINISGGFVGARMYQGGAASVLFDFEQAEGAIKGEVNDSALGRGTVTGSIRSNRVEFASIHNGGAQILEWYGTVDSSATRLNGTWRQVVGGTIEGNWTGSR